MLVPYPANQVIRVVLVLGKPKLALFTNDIENLEDMSVWFQKTTAKSHQDPPLQQHMSDKGIQLLSVLDRY